MKYLKALIVEDSEDDALMLLRHLKNTGYQVEFERVETAPAMEQALDADEWQIVLSDFSMPRFDGLGALAILKQSGRDVPFIMISGTIGEDTAVQAMLAGADDYFIKGNLSRLAPAIERELHEAENRRARRQAERELDENKKRLQLAIEATGSGVWEWNLRTNRIYWSPECYRIIRMETLGESLADFERYLHPEDVGTVMKAARRAIENHQTFVAEFRVINALGEIQWLANYGQTEYAADGTPLRLIGTVQDITERKRSEENLRVSEENFRALVQASTQFVWTADAEGNSRDLFEWFSELSGRRIETVEGITDILHPDDLEPARRDWEEALRDKKLFSFICRFLTKNGDYCYLAARSIPMFNANGTFRQWVGTFNDITDRMHAEEALRKNEFQLRVITDAVPALISYVDAGRIIRFANKSLLEWLARPAEKVVGRPVSEVLGEDLYQSLAEEIDLVLAGREMSFERTVPHSDESSRFIMISYVPDFDETGRPRGFFVFVIDLTENKRAEERLRKSEEQLRQAQKLESVGRLAGGIAHDFNNMLTAINGYSDLTLRRLEKDNPLRHNIEEIKKAGERSAALTQQLLTFSRLQILQVKKIDINQVINDSIVMLQRLIGEDIQVVSVLNPKIDLVETDPGQVSQLLLNLSVNARDAMPQGGTITIETENIYLDEEFIAQHAGAQAGHYVMLAVSDTGSGIDDETQQHIFEPFFTTKAVGKGTGLGLSTVYGIVKQSGGIIVLKTTVGTGTSFEIFLPSVRDRDAPAAVLPAAAVQSQGTGTILLVEDEEIVRNLSRQILESCGYEVIEARDGMEALAFCEQKKGSIDLLMTDVVMPQMSGRELAEKIVEVQPGINILFTSGYTDDEVVQYGVSESEVNFIQKPFTFDRLAKKVMDILHKEQS